MEYSHNFGSQFPDALIPYGTKLDVDNAVEELITQYYAFIDEGDITSAYELYKANKGKLAPYMINMEYINRLEEEIYNSGLLALKRTTNVISDTEPLDQADDGYWYLDY